jgi:hypothetical protein
MTEPNHRERELATFSSEVSPEGLLARYRDELLAPFEELRTDFAVLGDERAVKLLDELLQAAREGGAP